MARKIIEVCGGDFFFYERKKNFMNKIAPSHDIDKIITFEMRCMNSHYFAEVYFDCEADNKTRNDF